MSRSGWCGSVGVAALWLAMTASVEAQGIAPGQYAFDNLIPTPDRSPGGMVNNGVRRASQAVTPLDFTEIVETEPQLSLIEQLRLDAIDILVEEINDIFVFLVKQAFARAGVEVDENATGLPAGFDPSSILAGGDSAKSPAPSSSKRSATR